VPALALDARPLQAPAASRVAQLYSGGTTHVRLMSGSSRKDKAQQAGGGQTSDRKES